MGPLSPLVRSRMRIAVALAVACLLAGLVAFMVGSTPLATATATAASAPQVARVVAMAPSSDDWASLSATHRAILQPLQSRWDSLTPTFRAQWLKVADDLQGRPQVELSRAQSRMRAWAGLSRVQRAQARRRFKSESRIAAEERHRRWVAYSHRRDATTTSEPIRSAAPASPEPGMAGDGPRENLSMPVPPPTTVRQTIVPKPGLNKEDAS